ncbi:MAG: peptidoglycan-binding protein [Polyangiaceae bacterium]|nr:peptidoglycan-binding protein [Polyangiaceae bacterium]
MKPYVVKQGDCFELLAARHGVSVDELHGHAKNEALKSARPDPSVLGPGDVVWVPATPPPRPSISSGGTHRYKAPGALTRIEIALSDGAGEGLADKPYRLLVGRAVHEGQTTSEGVLEAKVPVTAKLGELVVWPGGTADEGDELRYTLHFGGLDPLSRPAGVVGRLENLGYEPRKDLGSALRAFQAARGLAQTGAADEATLQALCEAVGA